MTTAASVCVPHGANEGQQSISVTTSSAVSTNVIGAARAVVYSTVECFIFAGASPTATVAAGQPIPANVLVPITGLSPDDKLAAIAASGSGVLYIRPAA